MARREGGRTTAVQDASRESRPQAGPAGFGLRQSSGALAWAREEHGRNHSGRRTPQVGKAVEDYRSPRRFARFEAADGSARFWSAPVLWRFSSPFRRGIEVVGQIELIRLEPIDRLDLRGGGGSFEPRRRTPRILVRH